jgi:hypothetical protein
MYPVPEFTIPLFLKVLGTVLPGPQELFHLGVDMTTLSDRYHVEYVIEHNEPALKLARHPASLGKWRVRRRRY